MTENNFSMSESLRILWTILSDKNFFKNTIKNNIEIIKKEFPDAQITDDLSPHELIRSNESWMRVLGALLYANAILVISQIANKNMLNQKQLYFAAIYAWQRAIELVWNIKSLAIKTVLESIIAIYRSFNSFNQSTTAFVSGILHSIFVKDKQTGINITILLITSLLSAKMEDTALEIIGNIEKYLDEKRDKKQLILLLKIKEKILFNKSNFDAAEKTLDRIQKIDPSSPSMTLEKAKIEYIKGNYEKSLNLIGYLEKKKLLENNNIVISARIKVGSLYKLGKYKEVVAVIDSIENLIDNKDKIQFLIDKASALIELNKYNDAIATLLSAEELLESIEDNRKPYYKAKIYHGLGVSYASKGLNIKGREYLHKALSLIKSKKAMLSDEEKILIYLRLVAININLGLLEDALQLLDDLDKLLYRMNPELVKKYQKVIQNLRTIASLNMKLHN